MSNITKTLKKYGFSDHETKVYLALLKLVEVSAYRVAKQAELPRTSVYTALESLKNKRLIISSLRNNVRYYTPESPKMLIDLLDDKKDKLRKFCRS